MGELSKKTWKWLEHIRLMSEPGDSMYPGARVDCIPDRVATRLHEARYIEVSMPRNPVHKNRWVITERGRAALVTPSPVEKTDG